jgi:pyruvate/2-oxoglutarate dehydrogenase complex dihydrolipoamide acyltransferase (E2) component
MENETENLDSQNEEQGVEEQEDTDTSATDEKLTELEDKNRKLYERAKRAEQELKGLRDKPEAKAPKEEKKEKSDDFGLLQKTYLRAAGIVDDDEIELARRIQKETGMDWEKVPDSKYFKVELEDLKSEKANVKATSGVKGAGGKSDAKNTPEYWVAKGVPPTREQVPDRKTRATIARAMMASTKSSKMFYSD